MTTLITGGSGLIGSDVTEELGRRGEDVVVYDIEPPSDPLDNATAVEGDVLDREMLAGTIEDYDVDRVLHLAALIGGVTDRRPKDASRLSVVGTDNAFGAARETGVDRVAWASTLGIYGSSDNYGDEPVPEDVKPPAAFTEFPDYSYYVGLKQLNEYQSRLYARDGPDIHAARPTFVFGPKRERGWKGTVIDDALAGEATIPHHRDAVINLVYVADVADLFTRLLLDDPQHHVYNTGGHELTMGEIADTVERVTGGSVDCVPTEGPLSYPSTFDYSRAREDLGYDLTPFEDCVRDYVERVS